MLEKYQLHITHIYDSFCIPLKSTGSDYMFYRGKNKDHSFIEKTQGIQ